MSNFFNGGSGGGGSSLPALTDNGTVVTSTEQIQGVNNTLVSAPTYSFAGNATTGMYNNGAQIRFSSGGTLNTIMSSAGLFVNSITMAAGGSNDTFINRRSAANLQLGGADLNGSPVSQTLSFQNAITGSNLSGSVFTIDAPLGTGLGAGASTCLNRAIMKATGTTAQTSANAFAIGQSKTLSNTSATAQTIATITLGSNAGGGAAGTFTIVATDGTNFDSETQSFNVSFVNKAGAVTVGSVVATATTAANNSGSCTLGITAVANGNNIDIKVTPVFTTIVPTTVTLYPTISHCTGNVTFS